MSKLQRWFPFLAWPALGSGLFVSEALAGITVGLMVIPQSVAYAALAGMPLITGIYACLLPALVAVLWSSSSRLSVGPTALTCLLVASSLTGLATPGSAQWLLLAAWLALLSGLLQVLLGLVRFGWLLNLVSSPVLTGFTQAAAVLILLSQLPKLLGLNGAWRDMLNAPGLYWPAAAFGVISLIALLLMRRVSPRFPGVLLVVVLATTISGALGFEAAGGSVAGTLPSGLPDMHIPLWIGWSMLGQLMTPVLIITLVSFLETASSAKMESLRDGKLWNRDQDLIGQGLAKIASSLTGSFPTSSSFSRSALYLYAGARTGWATLFSVAVVLVTLLFFMPSLHALPDAVLAAVVIAAIYQVIKPGSFLTVWRTSKMEGITAATTFAVTLATAPQLYWGVVIGLLLSLSHFLYHRLHPRIVEIGIHPDGSLRDRNLWKLPPLAPRLYALRMDDELDFASAAAFERNILEYLALHPETRHICLFAQPINRIDTSGVEVFNQLRSSLSERGITLHVSGIKLPVENVLKRRGDWEPGPFLKTYRTDADALRALGQLQEELPVTP